MTLYLLRHGIAEPAGHGDPARDPHRALTPEGRRRIREIARGLRRLGVAPDLLLTSPLVRARQTAELVAEALDRADALEETPHLGVPPDSPALVRELNHRRPRPTSILLVGHEPHLSEFTGWLIAGKAGAGLVFKKGGLARLDVPTLLAGGRCARLEWLLPPQVLRRLN